LIKLADADPERAVTVTLYDDAVLAETYYQWFQHSTLGGVRRVVTVVAALVLPMVLYPPWEVVYGGAGRAQQHRLDAPPSPPASTASAQTVKGQRSDETPTSVQDHSALYVYVGDARLLVIDANGKRSGLDTATGEELTEIPQSGVGRDAIDGVSGKVSIGVLVTVTIDRPVEGTYRLIVAHASQDAQDLEVSVWNADGSHQPDVRVRLDFQKTPRAEFRLYLRKTPGRTSRLERVDPERR
jgi:hypothetical protein